MISQSEGGYVMMVSQSAAGNEGYLYAVPATNLMFSLKSSILIISFETSQFLKNISVVLDKNFKIFINCYDFF